MRRIECKKTRKEGNILNTELGKWAVVDIETSGINPLDDSIIDVGFLQFDGTKLIRKYSSLVRFPMSPLHHDNYSQFIQKLTGITQKMLRHSPIWEEVLPEIQSLVDHRILAHNSDFEESFLSDWLKMRPESFEEGEKAETSFEDSLYFLALTHPHKTSLNLESFIEEYGIREAELHRGYEDALDLLKIVLLTICRIRKSPIDYQCVRDRLSKNHLNQWWYSKLYNSSEDDIYTLAEEIGLDIEKHLISYSEYQIGRNDFSPLLDESMPNEVGEPNRPSSDFTASNIKSILENEQNIQRVLPNYRFRKGQLDLSIRVGQSLKSNTHAIIQAPTGTGKTLGYLLPTTLFAMETKNPVLVATGTKALQEQAMTKDIPQLKKILGDQNVKFSHLVGSSNHLCELLYRHEVQSENLLSEIMSFEEKFTLAYFDMLFQHNSVSQYEQKKLRADIPFVLKKKFPLLADKDQTYATDYRSCSGRNCPYKNDCSFIEGIKEAKDADVIIGNHSLMYSWPKSIPRPQHIIIDEAHKIENETTNACTLRVGKLDLDKISLALKNMTGVGALFYLLSQNEKSPGESTEEIKKIRDKLLTKYEIINDHLNPLDDLCEKYFKKLPRYTSLYWNEVPFNIRTIDKDLIGKRILNHLESIDNILASTTQFLLPYASRWESKDFKDESMITAWTKFESFYSHFSDTSLALRELLNTESSDPVTPWSKSVRYHEEHGYELISSPVNVGKVIHQHLLDNSSSVVFTSATLGNAYGDHGVKGVEWSTGYLYLENERRFKNGLFLPPLFNYKKQTKVYFCDDVPNLYDQKFVSDVISRTFKVVKEIGGRSLFLFSAKIRFEKARELLLERFDGELPVYIQGMGSNVVEEFRNAKNGILLGMESFGEGIDIPGDSLQFIFIDKIPDLRMDQVINDRRDFYETNIGNEFTDYYLGHRTRSLHQKLGRLIRRESDFGGIIVVDSRIKKWKGRTIEKLYRLMEPYQINRLPLETACDEVISFIKQQPKSEANLV